MVTASRVLIPDLPPELRNEIYKSVSTFETKPGASLFGLPLKLKTYECKHTIVHICPVHYGSTGLLALQTYRFEEAREYNSWLLNNAIELKIGVVFKGRINTFIQKDWDRKMAAHLKKLAKSHPWLEKVVKFDIQILWRPTDSALKSKKNRVVAGTIPRDMTTVLTALADDDLKLKKGSLDLTLRLDYGSAAAIECSRTRFGFAEFLSHPGGESNGFKSQTKRVLVELYNPRSSPKPGPLLVPVPSESQLNDTLLVMRNNSVRWSCDVRATVVVKRHIFDGIQTTTTVKGTEEPSMHHDHVVESIVKQCLGRR